LAGLNQSGERYPPSVHMIKMKALREHRGIHQRRAAELANGELAGIPVKTVFTKARAALW